MDRRGQAIGIHHMFLALGVGAVMAFIVSRIATPLLSRAETSTADGAYAAKGTDWLSAGVDHLWIVFLILSFFGIIAYSVYAREVLR